MKTNSIAPCPCPCPSFTGPPRAQPAELSWLSRLSWLSQLGWLSWLGRLSWRSRLSRPCQLAKPAQSAQPAPPRTVLARTLRPWAQRILATGIQPLDFRKMKTLKTNSVFGGGCVGPSSYVAISFITKSADHPHPQRISQNEDVHFVIFEFV